MDPVTNEYLTLPIAPETMKVQIDSKVLNFETIWLGKIEIPKGRLPYRFTLSGFLPGLNQNVPSRASELSPEEIVQQFKKWSDEGPSTGKKLRFIVTETDWNIPVFFSSFSPNYSGGLGDIEYTMELTEFRDFTVKEVKPQSSEKIAVRETPPVPKTYTVKKGDNLWAIARKHTGSGAKWTELWEINKANSKSKNPDLIYPGETFTIPAGWLT